MRWTCTPPHFSRPERRLSGKRRTQPGTGRCVAILPDSGETQVELEGPCDTFRVKGDDGEGAIFDGPRDGLESVCYVFRAEGALEDKVPRRSCGGLAVGFDEGPMFGLAFDGTRRDHPRGGPEFV